jgi:beta-galactosidase
MYSSIELENVFTCMVISGIESGYGPNFAAISAWLKDFDPTRPIHYEGAQGLNGEPDPATVDVISRFYPRLQQEYLSPGIAENSTVERAENARWERLLDIAQRTNDNRPVLTSEYAHSMGNALGNFQEYWDEIYSNKRMLGGFIWDWVDQGIYKTLPNGKTQVSYGGDFGDVPNLKAFCFNGIVMSDRETTPKYEEVRKVYQPIDIKRVNGDIQIINRNHHTNLSAYRCNWTITHYGKIKYKGELNIPDLNPGDTTIISSPDSMVVLPAGDFNLNIYFSLKKENTWAKAGYLIAYEQFNIQTAKIVANPISNKGKLSVKTENDNLIANGKSFSIRWNTKNGNLNSLIYNGKEMLATNARDFENQPVVQAFRAPTDNDKGFGNWLAKDWKLQELDSPKVSVDSVHHFVRNDGALVVEVKKTNHYKIGQLQTKLIYTITFDGEIDLECRFNPIGELPELPRLGIALALNGDYENFSWYGRGPHENYPDRKTSALMGLWSGKVSEQAVKYPRPQDTGNKEDIHFLSLTNSKNQGIKVNALDKTFSASAMHYSVNDLANETHECNLILRKEVILSIDCAVLGLGNSSCGPGVLKKYAIEKNEHVLHLRIQKM